MFTWVQTKSNQYPLISQCPSVWNYFLSSFEAEQYWNSGREINQIRCFWCYSILIDWCFCRVSKKLGNAPSLPLELTRGRFSFLKKTKKIGTEDDDHDDKYCNLHHMMMMMMMMMIMIGFNMLVNRGLQV